MEKYKWKENLKFGELTRKQYRIYRNLLRILLIFSIFSLVFVYSGAEAQIGGNKLYKAFLIFLNIVTFVGIVFPVSIKKNITEDVKKIIEKKKEEDDRNKNLEDRATL